MEEKGMNAKAISDLLWYDSGLLGVSGISNDMRDLHASGAPHAKEAIDLFVYRICRELGAASRRQPARSSTNARCACWRKEMI
jgi:acetate kinase